MKQKILVLGILVSIIGCRYSPRSDSFNDQPTNADIANTFIDAFYSFNSDSLASILFYAVESQPSILYYQKWAECGNYEIIQRNAFIERNDSIILCPITVKDDLIGSLKIKFNVTDTFHLTIINGHINSAQTSSNDPEIYYAAKDWVRLNRPELINEPCEGIMEGGPTPCECVRGMVEGFKQFLNSQE
jgi:hypothetical protein